MVALQSHEKTIIKILIVDPYPAAREGLSLRLSAETDYVVCGDVGDIKSALHLVDTAKPDVVVLDVALSGGSGIDLLRKIKDRDPTIRVLVWSRYRESVYAERVIRFGAVGYIEKAQPTSMVVEAIRLILCGKVYLSPAIIETMVQQSVGSNQALSSDPLSELSDRELEVFRLIGLCYDTNEIAAQLHLSTKTVETYRGRIRQKFGGETSAKILQHAVRWELENG